MTVLEILRDLISINTVNPPGNERAAAAYLKGLLEPAGFACAVQELGDGRANFSAQIGSGEGPELIWNGHLDVVPAAGGWDTDPFTLSRTGDRVYGRGVCDMKGGLAAMCRAALNLAEKGGVGRGTLKLLFVADEEDANRGLKAYLRESGFCPGTAGAAGYPDKVGGRWRERYAVIGEPTDLEVAVAHRGVVRSYVDIRGTARHAALPEDGNSSIGKLPKVLRAIEALNGKLGARKHPVLPPPGISVTMVRAYEKDNIVPGKVRLLTDFRILPDMGREEAEGLLKEAVAGAGTGPVQVTSHFFMPGGEIVPEEPFVKLCCRAAGQIRGKEAVPRAFDASCEQCFLTAAGVKTVILGPGSLKQAHTQNEFLEVEQLKQAVAVYEQIARQILGRPVVKEMGNQV